MSRIEQLIGEIEEYIDGCKFQPLSNSKIVVNKEEIEELLVELRLRIPDEIKKYQKIISNQDAILGEARTQADTMIQEATVHTNELVNEHEIMQRAYSAANQVVEDANAQAQATLDSANAQAQAMVDSAVNDANHIRQSAVQYTDDMLNSLQAIISHTLDGAQGRFGDFISSMQSSYEIVSSNRAELSGAVVNEPEETSAS
ncbi:MAG: vacuolar family H+-ATPase subunit H, partial [Hungatella sp.]